MRAPVILFFLSTALAAAGCSTGGAAAAPNEPVAIKPVTVDPVLVAEQPIIRFVRATGSLTAEDQADVAAETGGRVIATPVERGSEVAAGAELVRVSATESDAQVKEAEANAAQLEARLGLTAGQPLNVSGVPEVQQAKAALDLASSEHARFKSLHDEGVIAPADLDQRRAQLESARQQYEAAKNTAAQQYQALQAARARVTLARKTLADTVVRAPFSGVVAERLVSVGDYVTKGTKVAVVVRVNPLRVRLTIPEQFVASVAVGQKVSFEVDAYNGRAFEGVVKYVSPALEANQRALTVEAVVPNPRGELKPGLFATARLQQPAPQPGLVVPPSAVLTTAGTSRVFVVNGDCVEERIVTVGQTVEAGVEITSGLKPGDRVATRNVPQLADGMPVAL